MGQHTLRLEGPKRFLNLINLGIETLSQKHFPRKIKQLSPILFKNTKTTPFIENIKASARQS